ncbi:hypothetical protein [Deinococcus humi]|uniref:Uncharacterized protein n=1 Tax=Deinococcus humi TaxID=662880 RepID=A0A7W8K0H4_9DEIO|nr:hypothetical protein [Deinococcus humi]MBB5366385.1 hypothetical protein [Deinococcus humi]GGO41528.1 hypothetical protein GCM10008949_52510 [Deinococcus humi]
MIQSPQEDVTAYTKLSDILARFPEDKRYKVYSRLKRQIKRGQLRSVFTLGWVLIPHRKKLVRVPELLIYMALEAWIQHTLTEFSSAGKRQPKATTATAEHH